MAEPLKTDMLEVTVKVCRFALLPGMKILKKLRRSCLLSFCSTQYISNGKNHQKGDAVRHDSA